MVANLSPGKSKSDRESRTQAKLNQCQLPSNSQTPSNSLMRKARSESREELKISQREEETEIINLKGLVRIGMAE